MYTDNFENFVRFTRAAMKDLEKGEEKNFICPLCGGRAYASRMINGHLHAKCVDCKASIAH